MLIGARTGAWSGGAKLPYDAEVEYIRRPVNGAGVRWTLPYKPETDDVIEWSASIENSGSWVTAGFMSYVNENTECVRVTKSGGSYSKGCAWFRRVAGNGGTYINVNVGQANKYKLFRGCVEVNGNAYTISDISSLSENRGNYILLYNSGTTLYYFKITRGGIPLCDLVPVRFNDEDGSVSGGFYDRTNKVLIKKDDDYFGPYEIGPDK